MNNNTLDLSVLDLCLCGEYFMKYLNGNISFTRSGGKKPTSCLICDKELKDPITPRLCNTCTRWCEICGKRLGADETRNWESYWPRCSGDCFFVGLPVKS